MARRIKFIHCPNCGKKGGHRTMVREVFPSDPKRDRLLWACRYCMAGFWTDPDENVLEVIPHTEQE